MDKSLYKGNPSTEQSSKRIKGHQNETGRLFSYSLANQSFLGDTVHGWPNKAEPGRNERILREQHDTFIIHAVFFKDHVPYDAAR